MEKQSFCRKPSEHVTAHSTSQLIGLACLVPNIARCRTSITCCYCMLLLPTSYSVLLLHAATAYCVQRAAAAVLPYGFQTFPGGAVFAYLF